jgi:hypothetical protein
MARITRVEDSLARVGSSADADRHLVHVRVAIVELEALLRYEEHGLARIRPKPSMLLRVVTEKEKQLLRDQRPSAASLAAAGSRKVGPEPSPDAKVDSRSDPRDLEQRPIAVPHFEPDGLAPDEWLSDGADESLFEEYLHGLNRKWTEKRREHRGRVSCPVHVDPGGIRGSVRDLSPSGLSLLTHTPFSQVRGSPVCLTLSTSSGPIRAESVVRWVERHRGADRNPSRVGMGVEFDQASEELTQLVHILPR